MKSHAATMWVIIEGEPKAFLGTGVVFSSKGTAAFLIRVDKDDLVDPNRISNKVEFKMKDHGKAKYSDPDFLLHQLSTPNLGCNKTTCPPVGSAIHDQGSFGE